MKILVLGGTGAMGTPLVELLGDSEDNQVDVTSRAEHDSRRDNVRYLRGNARDNSFLEGLLGGRYDVIVDFMNYDLDEFAARHVRLLASAGQYVWFSSARVYARSDAPLTERSPRLLETTTDAAFLATNRYALRKARQEELLRHSGFRNHTIVRPYVTYGEQRLQLGIYEKEQWLHRLLRGHSLVVNRNILGKKTAMTFGRDVASAVAELAGNPAAVGQTVQIATGQTMTWKEILDLYLGAIREKTGLSPRIFQCDAMMKVDGLYEGGYNTIYDREWDRSFDSSFADRLVGRKIGYTAMRTGLRACIGAFLDGKREFRTIDWDFEAYQDLLAGERTPREAMPSDAAFSVYSAIRNGTPDDVIGENGHLEVLA